MHVDAIGPRTWLAAGLACVSMLALVLAWAGLGGHVAPLKVDPTLAPALPQLAPAAPDRLGPMAQYAAISQQPLFSPDRQPHPFFLEGQAGPQDVSGQLDYVLTGVLMTPKVKLAILQPPGKPQAAVRVKLADTVPSSPAWRLLELSARQAVFAGPAGQRTLKLRVFDGQGGLGPTIPVGPASGVTGVRVALPTAAHAQDKSAATPAEMTQEEQMRRIRERIQARRQQLQKQQN